MTDREILELLLKEMSEIKTDVKSIKMTLETEIRTNIQRVSEGHLD